MDDKPRSPVKTINAMKARQTFGQLLEQIYYRGEQFIIERAGKPMAALVPLSQLEAIQKPSVPSPKSSKRKTKRTG